MLSMEQQVFLLVPWQCHQWYFQFPIDRNFVLPLKEPPQCLDFFGTIDSQPFAMHVGFVPVDKKFMND